MMRFRYFVNLYFWYVFAVSNTFLDIISLIKNDTVYARRNDEQQKVICKYSTKELVLGRN